MIKYNNSDIIDWNFDDSNIIKVYHNGAIVFYKFDSEQGGYKVCYAVVDDITQYSETEFEDVYDKATEKWYKLNNLNQYEEYGVYASGRTSCEGSSRLPQGYTEVEYIRQNSNYNAYINTGVIIFDNTTNTYTITTRLTSEFHSNLGCATIISCEALSSPYNGLGYRYKCSSTVDQLEFFGGNANYNSSVVDNGDGTRTVTFQSTGNTSYTTNVPLSFLCSFNNSSYTSAYRFADATIYSSTIVKNGTTVRDFVPAKRDSDSVYGLYDLINDVFYTSPNGNNFIGGEPVTPTDCVTTYEGKLTIDDGYEYEWNDSSWVNLGEVSGSSKTSDFKIGDIKERVTTGVSNGDYLLFSYYNKSDISKPENIMSYNPSNNYLSNLSGYGITSIDSTTIIDPSIWLLESTASANTFYIKSIKNNLYWGYQSKDSSRSLNLVDSSSSQKAPVLITPSCKENCYGFVEKKSNASNGYGGYGLNQLYSYTYQLNWWNDFSSNDPCAFFTTDGNADFIIYKMNANDVEYPKYYSEKSEPLDNLTFNTMADAQAYAEANCVYDGMHATIGTDRYYFDSTDENGWVKILEYYKVEDVTPGGASGWTISGSSTYNPDSSYYDDFDLQTTSTSYATKIAKVTIYGYDHFTYYIRSYHPYSSSYGYVMATNVDEVSTPTSTMQYYSESAIANTYNFNKTAGSAVNFNNYRRVTYNNLDKTVEHTFYVYFYGRTYSIYVGNATILIPKEQSNENWEQVTFSASSNVASSTKNLYIDGNASTSGGTDRFYYRWIVGLPSGSHTSYTNYSSYDYCPNTTSSTFTSVAGEQRQVNFTYDNATNKNLSMRLVDSNGNVLSPSDTVYYYIYRYNSCNISNNASISLPSTQTLKVGGRFYFSNSSNRHYIYGYTAPATGTTYYVDNYSSTFDLVYTALTREAVSVTYTTYDPNDSETPAFKTNITWPYNGGTTSSTTLTSYDVPYTYSYTVSQTSNMFSASTASYTYTAGQSSRTITFTLYPNNREFASVSDMEAYAYAWEGMNATVNGTKYEYKNGEWVEKSYVQYEYIRTQSGSTKHYYNFNTNFYPTTANTLEIKFTMTDNSIDWGRIVAWGTPGNTSYNNSFEFDTVTRGYQAIVRTGGNNGVTYRPRIGANKVGVYTLPLSGSSGTYSVNGGSSQTIQYNHNSLFSLPSTVSMRIFGGLNNDGATYNAAAVGKLYYVKVYDGNNNLVKHYVPSDNNGTPCFYEIVNGEYIMDTYTGSNHGTLTLGPAVN